MTREQIDRLLRTRSLPQPCGDPDLIETHISWLLRCDQFVYKIKKPVKFDFLDFSTPELREQYCLREIALNRRLTHGLYLQVEPVSEEGDTVRLGVNSGKVIDHAVKMTRLDENHKMDVLLSRSGVTVEQVQAIAARLAGFHQKTAVVHFGVQLQVQHDFNDLLHYRKDIEHYLGKRSYEVIRRASETVKQFLTRHTELLNRRSNEGFIRDGHGDLHSGNIFLLAEPVIFDCIEFDDKLRQVDVLNELAFLCMDLESRGFPGLSNAFFTYYNNLFPVCGTNEEQELFTFYKACKANVRAKIDLINATKPTNGHTKERSLKTCQRHLGLMHQYLEDLR